MRIKGRLGSGKDLEQTILMLPGASPQSGGTLPLPLPPATTPTPTTPPSVTPTTTPPSPFGGSTPPPIVVNDSFGTPPKSPVNLLGEVEKWGIGAATTVSNININVSQMTGAQLTEMLKKLPDGVTYALNLEKVKQ